MFGGARDVSKKANLGAPLELSVFVSPVHIALSRASCSHVARMRLATVEWREGIGSG